MKGIKGSGIPAYDKCPMCGGLKTGISKLCFDCRCATNRPPVIEDIVYIEGEPCRRLPLTRGLYTNVNDYLYDYLMQWNWHAWGTKSDGFYATRPYGESRKGQVLRMHHAIIGLYYSKVPRVDHINHDTLDNRLSNLRPATHRQNICNQKLRVNNKSGFKGVSWHKGAQKWMAALTDHKQNVYLGIFPFKEDAARAYDIAAIKYFGEFAYLNFPEEYGYKPHLLNPVLPQQAVLIS